MSLEPQLKHALLCQYEHVCEPKNHHGVAIGHKDQDHIRNEEGKKGNKERMKNKGKNKKKSPGRMHF